MKKEFKITKFFSASSGGSTYEAVIAEELSMPIRLFVQAIAMGAQRVRLPMQLVIYQTEKAGDRLTAVPGLLRR